MTFFFSAFLGLSLLTHDIAVPSTIPFLTSFFRAQHHTLTQPNVNAQQQQASRKNNTTYRKNKRHCDKEIDIGDAEEIVLLTDGVFFHRLSEALAEAKSEIWLSTFLFKTTRHKNNRASHIVRLLKKKAKEKVAVKLLLEKSNYHQSISKENHLLAKRLRKDGIEVYFDSVKRTMHSKAVVIDRKTVFLGSHNMTDSAFRRNHETSLLIKSPTLSKALIAYFEQIMAKTHEK